MTDNKQFQQVHDASWNVIDSIRETNQSIADSLVTIQDHNLKLAQNIFLSWMELFTGQAESIQHLQQRWGEQARTRQDAFQKLASTSTQIYMNFLLAPFSFSRRLIDAAEDTVEQEQEAARKAARH
jgi:hypothetical protein